MGMPLQGMADPAGRSGPHRMAYSFHIRPCALLIAKHRTGGTKTMDKRYGPMMICIYLMVANMRRRIAPRRGADHAKVREMRKTD